MLFKTKILAFCKKNIVSGFIRLFLLPFDTHIGYCIFETLLMA